MDTNQIVIELDREIARLRQARELLSNGGARGGKPVEGDRIKRVLSPEAREKIAAAQRLRWAKSKKAAKKSS